MPEDNNNQGNLQILIKRILKATIRKFAIPVAIVIGIGVALAAFLYHMDKLDTKENSKDIKNGPAAVRNLMNSTSIDSNGNIKLDKPISEYWEELKKNNNKITEYLKTPEELAKLVNASLATQYLDTRENPDEPIDWDKINKEMVGEAKKAKTKDSEETPESNNDDNSDDRYESLGMCYVTSRELEEFGAGFEKGTGWIATINKKWLKPKSEGGLGIRIGDKIILGDSTTEITIKAAEQDNATDAPHFYVRAGGKIKTDKNGKIEVFRVKYASENQEETKTENTPTTSEGVNVQGIIKLKRRTENDETITMTYVEPSVLQSYINSYNSAESDEEREQIKQEAITHFTLEKEDSGGTVNLPANLANLQAKDLFPMGNIAYNHSSPDDGEGAQARQYIFDTVAALVSAAHSKFPMKKSLVIAQVVLECGWIHESSSPLVRDWNNVLSVNDFGDGALTSPYSTWYQKGQKKDYTMMSHPGGSTNDPAKVYDNLYEAIEDYMAQFIYHHPAETFGDYDDLSNYRKYLGGYTEMIPGWGNNIVGYYEHMIKKYGLDKYDSMPDSSVGGAAGSSSEEGESLGFWRVTCYADTPEDQGPYVGQTASGSPLKQGETVAVPAGMLKPKSQGGLGLKFGDKISILGNTFTIEDTGDSIMNNSWASGKGWVDIFVNDYHNEFAKKYLNTEEAEVFLVSGDGATGGTGGTSAKGEEIVKYAKQFVGNPYVWGGNSLTNGCDCSHFVYNVFKNCGVYNGEYLTSREWITVGEPVGTGESLSKDLEQAVAGDAIVWDGHIAIYDGNGKMVEAKGKNYGIVDTYEPSSSHPYLGIRRFTSDVSSAGTKSGTGIYKYVAKVIKWKEHEEILDVEPDDDDIEEYDVKTYTMTTETIDYQKYVSKYHMPFNYLWTMLVLGQDKDFVSELADLVFGSEFEITVHDNVTESVSERTETYTKEITVNVEVQTGEEADGTPITETQPETYEEEHTKIFTTIDITDTLDIALTKANAWCADYSAEYEKYEGEAIISETEPEKLDDSEKTEFKFKSEEDDDGENDDEEENSEDDEELKKREEQITEKVKDGKNLGGRDLIKVEDYSILEKNRETKSKTTIKQIVKYTSQKIRAKDRTEEPNFETIFKKYYNARQNILGVKTWLFEILASNDDTKDMVDMTKYLIYKATGVNYGVTVFDFSVYEPERFIALDEELYGRTNEEKIWIALRNAGFSEVATAAAMGNMSVDSNLRSNNLEDSYERKIASDTLYTARVNVGMSNSTEEDTENVKYERYEKEDFISDEAGYGLCMWKTKERKEGLYDYISEKHINIDNLKAQIEYFVAEVKGETEDTKDAAKYATQITEGKAKIEKKMTEEKEWEEAQTISEATMKFLKFYVQPDDLMSFDKRKEAAEKYYEMFHGVTGPKSGKTGIADGTATKEGWTTMGNVSIPIYKQGGDAPWASKDYLGRECRYRGCGPCALAMAVSGLTSSDVTPDIIIDKLNQIGNLMSAGTGAEAAAYIAKEYGLTYRQIGGGWSGLSSSEIADLNQALQSGHVVVLSSGCTANGHFIIVYGYKDGGYYVTDSGSSYNPDTLYTYEQVFFDIHQGLFVLGKN